ncbi:MAG: LodA/GoxA family CTQ-dependent oxidase, partial [Bacteroidetes bacterium]|nr:LodA/GoxA family CTQ-dependent oxidase [Bacteroidota bacterium]
GYKDGKNPYIKGEKNVFPPLRNPSFTGEGRYRALVIDPGPRALSGKGNKEVHFDVASVATYGDGDTIKDSKNYPKSFPQDQFDELYSPAGEIDSLGSATTDKYGRLIVAGGYGKAVSWITNEDEMNSGQPLESDTDNDGWLDDTADGPVYATVIFADGSVMEAESAWVVSTDPAYAPQVLNSVSLWDEFYDTFVRNYDLVPELFKGGKFNPDYPVNFKLDIQPFIQSGNLQQWTTNLPLNAVQRHKAISKLTTLKGFKFRDFIRRSDETMSQSKMPLSLGDSGSAFLTPTLTQDHLIQTAYEKGELAPDQDLGPGEKLDRASLMNCLGGRFSPGIDMTFIVRQPDLYVADWKKSGPFRINARKIDYAKMSKDTPALGEGYIPCQNNSAGVDPGDTSKYMALPWHTDYNSCAVHNPSVPPENPNTLYWSWPAQRPYAVRIADEVNSMFYFTSQNIDDMISGLGGSPGFSPAELEAFLQDEGNEQTILGISTYSEKDCIAQVKDALEGGGLPEKSEYVTYIMGYVSTEIDSPYRFSVRGKDSSGLFGPSSGNYYDSLNMVKNWADIGVIVQGKAIDTVKLGPHNDDYLLETVSRLNIHNEMEEMPPWPDYTPIARLLYYQLQNVDNYPNAVPKARMYTEHVLKGAWDYANGKEADGYVGTVDALGRYFPYTKEAYRKRMDDVYRSLAYQEEGYEPANDPLFKSRKDCVVRVTQLAPYNLADGAWLRNINSAGPITEVKALLSSIEEDERGNGDPSMNHCNIYLDLCHSVGFYPFPVESQEFALDTRFEDSAFPVAAFELAISQFTENYFPEILGMTLFLEWSVLELKNTIKLFDYYNIDPHFYVMHVGIDNAANGHGQRAKEAIEVYLDQILSTSGEKAMEEAWKRIWTGYTAFGNWGSGGADIQDLLSVDSDSQSELHKRMIALVRDKAEYGMYNHDQHKLGGRLINDWFADPEGFLRELVNAGYIIPGDAKNSRFFQLLEFETGVMFRIFTQDEIQLWKDWTNSLNQALPIRVPTTPLQDMVEMVKVLNQQQMGNKQHQNITIKNKRGVEKSVADWFKGHVDEFLEALANEENGWVVPGNPENSLLLNELMSTDNRMGQAASGVIPNTGGKTGRQVTINWINSLKIAPPKRRKNMKIYLSSIHQHEGGSKPIIRGQGTIH